MKAFTMPTVSILIILLSLSTCQSLQAEWVKLNPSQRISPRRSGHVAFRHDKTPFVFGGYVEEDGGEPLPNRYVKNDLWQWKDEKWQQCKPKGDIPGPRLVAATGVVNDKVYLFGGWDPGTKGDGGAILDDVHELNLSTMAWTKLEATTPGGPTSRHVALALPEESSILLHNHRCDTFVYLFDPKTNKFSKQATTGPSPSSRGLHAATLVGTDKVVIFGGAAQDQNMSNEAFLLDTKSWEWSLLAEKQGPSPRAGPTLCTLNENCVLLFGGAESTDTGLNPRGDVWALHLNNGQWELLVDDTDETITRPPPRNAATFSEINDDKDGKRFLLTGGWAPFRETWDDCYMLQVTE